MKKLKVIAMLALIAAAVGTFVACHKNQGTKCTISETASKIGQDVSDAATKVGSDVSQAVSDIGDDINEAVTELKGKMK